MKFAMLKLVFPLKEENLQTIQSLAAERRNLNTNMEREKIILKLNHIIFWWYYKRVPVFFRKWTILKSIKILVSNYEHAEYRYEGLEEVVRSASKRETEMRSEISNLKLKLMGVSQEMIDPLNKMFGTKLQGKSTQERDN